jgi:hypothetical protein
MPDYFRTYFFLFIQDKNIRTGRGPASNPHRPKRAQPILYLMSSLGKHHESSGMLLEVLCQKEQVSKRRIHNLTHLDSDPKWFTVYQESVQSNVSSQGAFPSVVGGQIGTKPTPFARVATKKGRAYGKTFFHRIK